MNNFISIKKNVETEIIVKKSKFICNLIKVESQKEAFYLYNIISK